MNNPRKIDYEIYKYSSYSTSYLPENIREDCPHNQTSRWSSNTNTPPQFLLLKLQRPTIVTHIKFGKHEKTHVCNLKRFRIYGGLVEDKLELLLIGGLRNDSVPETFALQSGAYQEDASVHQPNESLAPMPLALASPQQQQQQQQQQQKPIVYLKIVPQLSWGPSFNFSIWYVELHGRDDPIDVQESLRAYSIQLELALVRLCLKHFRQQGYGEAFEALHRETRVRLEDARMTAFHETLVQRGDFEAAEQQLRRFVGDGLIDGFLERHEFAATWAQRLPERPQRLSAADADAEDLTQPGMRGGHQLVVDSERGCMYLFGGWDGWNDLSDMWTYDMEASRWQRLHARAEELGGPGPRSCHKMVFDPVNRNIFVLGRYVDTAKRHQATEDMNSDFYLYDTQRDTWLLICEDTHAVGGPRLMFDHQMCIDAAHQTIYVFGGRVLTPSNGNSRRPPGSSSCTNGVRYSGLYSYHIPTNTWQQLLIDCGHPNAADPDVLSIKSRVTHSMLFHDGKRMLYIFGGQRNKVYTPDFLSYNVDTHELATVEVATDVTGGMGASDGTYTITMPQSGFTQRATIDTERDEIYVLSSLSKEKEHRDLYLNSFWLFALATKTWTCVYSTDHSPEQCTSTIITPTNTASINTINSTGSSCAHKSTQTFVASLREPCPRFAHTLVYDQRRRVHYLFGGNPGKSTLPKLRLDDFWSLRLDKPSREQVLRQHCWLLRRQRYVEMAAAGDAMRALQYLREHLSECIDRDDPKQLREFHQLTALLFSGNNNNQPMTTTGGVMRNETMDYREANGMTSSSATDSGCSTSTMSPVSSSSLSPTPTQTTTKTRQMRRPHSMDDDDSVDDNAADGRPIEQLSPAQALNDRFVGADADGQREMQRRRRALLYEKIASMMPSEMVQPTGRLSDVALASMAGDVMDLLG